MNLPRKSVLSELLRRLLADAGTRRLVETVRIPTPLAADEGPLASRAVIALALNLRLLAGLVDRVPTARAYIEDLAVAGGQLVFDHGALRTIALDGMGNLPAGERAITRILEPLGYRRSGIYPLDRLGMTGRSYTQMDFAEALPQFFVSELHPERFSSPFQDSVRRVTAGSIDPLSNGDLALLDRLASAGALPLDEASRLLPKLAACFDRQHQTPLLADYETLLAESAEMAWIATEGNAFNHATNRVPSLAALVAEQRALSRPLKDEIEVSRSGRIRQTAYRADPVDRAFLDAKGKIVHRQVPGSFFEFIERGRIVDPDTGVDRLDLGFDSGNAQGIFRMTAGT